MMIDVAQSAASLLIAIMAIAVPLALADFAIKFRAAWRKLERDHDHE